MILGFFRTRLYVFAEKCEKKSKIEKLIIFDRYKFNFIALHQNIDKSAERDLVESSALIFFLILKLSDSRSELPDLDPVISI